MLPNGDGRSYDDDELDLMLAALADLAQAIASGHSEAMRLLSVTLESQGTMLDVLEQLAARVAAVDVESASLAEPGEARGADEALRREARQAVRHTGELVAQSQALMARATALERDILPLVSANGRPSRNPHSTSTEQSPLWTSDCDDPADLF